MADETDKKVPEEPTEKKSKTKSTSLAEVKEAVEKTNNAKTVSVDAVKYAKLVSGARQALAQYKSNHRELTYPGFQDLEDGLP